MISLIGLGKAFKRNGWFHKPMANIKSLSYEAPFHPSKHEVTYHRLFGWNSMVLFRGWSSPQRKWGSWVNKLWPLYADLWAVVGISDAIAASTYKIRREKSSMFGIPDFWSEEMNTSIFQRYEATVTLEDIMVLGRFSGVGRCARKMEPLDDACKELHLEMIRDYRAFSGRASKQPCHSAWLNHFMRRNGDELEHFAFLSRSLSQYVFPGPPKGFVRQDLFPIAILLARGSRFALEPVVLADLYQDLWTLRQKINANGDNEAPPVMAWAPFQILQLWVWEHYKALRPKVNPHFVHFNESRSARWHKLSVIVEIPTVRSILESHDEFEWHSYTDYMNRWRMPSFYRNNNECVSLEKNIADKKRMLPCRRKQQNLQVDLIAPFSDCNDITKLDNSENLHSVEHYKLSSSADQGRQQQSETELFLSAAIGEKLGESVNGLGQTKKAKRKVGETSAIVLLDCLSGGKGLHRTNVAESMDDQIV